MTAVLIIAAITIGLAVLTVIGMAGSVIMVRLLPQKPPPSVEILRERYARGEISEEQFDEMRRHLAA